MASTKFGIDSAVSATPLARRSPRRLARYAAYTPSGTAISRARIWAYSISCSDTGIALAMAVETSWPWIAERPRSPRSASLNHSM